jgi:hypothetical protein
MEHHHAARNVAAPRKFPTTASQAKYIEDYSDIFAGTCPNGSGIERTRADHSRETFHHAC